MTTRADWTDAEIGDLWGFLPDGTAEIHEDLWAACEHDPALRARVDQIIIGERERLARELADASKWESAPIPTPEQREDVLRRIQEILARKENR